MSMFGRNNMDLEEWSRRRKLMENRNTGVEPWVDLLQQRLDAQYAAMAMPPSAPASAPPPTVTGTPPDLASLPFSAAENAPGSFAQSPQSGQQPVTDMELRRRLANLKNMQRLAARQGQASVQGGQHSDRIAAGQLAAAPVRSEIDEIRRMLAAQQGARNIEMQAAIAKDNPDYQIQAAQQLDAQVLPAQRMNMDSAGSELSRAMELAQRYPGLRADQMVAEAQAQYAAAADFSPEPSTRFTEEALARKETPRDFGPEIERRRQLLEQTRQPVDERINQERADMATALERRRQIEEAMQAAQLREIGQIAQPDKSEFESLADQVLEYGDRPGVIGAIFDQYMGSRGINLGTAEAEQELSRVASTPALSAALGSISGAVSAYVENPKDHQAMQQLSSSMRRIRSLPERDRKAVTDAFVLQIMASNPAIYNELEKTIRTGFFEALGQTGLLTKLIDSYKWLRDGDDPSTRNARSNDIRRELLDFISTQ